MEKAYSVDVVVSRGEGRGVRAESILSRCGGNKVEEKAYLVDLEESKARRKHT